VTDLKQLLGFPFKEREWFIKMIMGSVITLVPVVNFLSLGYFLRCVNYGWRGLRIIPDWSNWAELFRDGCIVFLIILAYLVFPISIAFLMLMVPIVGTAFASLTVFIMSLFIPMAIANYAVHKNMRDAFMLVDIFHQVGRVMSFYLIAYLTAALGVIIGAALLLGLPLLGFIGGIIIFYCGVVFFNLLGFLYHDAC